MDSTFFTRESLTVDDTAKIDNGFKSISGKVTGVTLMLYTMPIVIICHVSEELDDEETTAINDYVYSYRA